MATNRVSANSQWYPYTKVYEGFGDLSQTVNIPRKVMDYLLDMPDGYYTPQDNNEWARVRLWKYLYYDEAQPLSQPLPTPQEKMSVLFDPEEPTKPATDKGYRLFPEIYVKPSQTDAQTRIYTYMGRTIATDDFEVQLSVTFDIWTHYTSEPNTKTSAYSRVFAIEQALIEAFHGVPMAGVGSFYFNKAKHPDCGSQPMRDDNSNIGRHLVFGLSVKSETPNGDIAENEERIGDGNFYIGL